VPVPALVPSVRLKLPKAIEVFASRLMLSANCAKSKVSFAISVDVIVLSSISVEVTPPVLIVTSPLDTAKLAVLNVATPFCAEVALAIVSVYVPDAILLLMPCAAVPLIVRVLPSETDPGPPESAAREILLFCKSVFVTLPSTIDAEFTDAVLINPLLLTVNLVTPLADAVIKSPELLLFILRAAFDPIPPETDKIAGVFEELPTYTPVLLSEERIVLPVPFGAMVKLLLFPVLMVPAFANVRLVALTPIVSIDATPVSAPPVDTFKPPFDVSANVPVLLPILTFPVLVVPRARTPEPFGTIVRFALPDGV